MVGALHLRRGLRLVSSRRGLGVVVSLAAYLCWSMTSLLWTDQPAMTLRRLGVLLLVCLGSFGLGFGYYGRQKDGIVQYARHVFIGGVIGAIMLIGHSYSDLAAARWLDPSWVISNRGVFSEFTAINAYALLSAVYLFWRRPRQMICWSLPLITAFLLTKSRSVAGFAAVTVFLLFVLLRRGNRTLRVASGLAVASVALALVLCNAPYWNGAAESTGAVSKLQSIIPVFEGERSSTIDSLNGRIPLWNVVLQYSSVHPWHGYGYGAFWSPNRLLDIWNRIGWFAPSAHDGLLDEVLGTGFVGLSLLLLTWVIAMKRCLSLLIHRGLPSAGLVFCFLFLTLLYNFSTSIFQFPFAVPFIASLVGLYALFGQTCAPRMRKRRRVLKVGHLQVE
jgi:exopolysaccharide production protein ExoQ